MKGAFTPGLSEVPASETLTTPNLRQKKKEQPRALRTEGGVRRFCFSAVEKDVSVRGQGLVGMNSENGRGDL